MISPRSSSMDIDVIAHIDAMRREVGEEMRLLRIGLQQATVEISDLKVQLTALQASSDTIKGNRQGWFSKAMDNDGAKFVIGLGAILLAVVGLISNGLSILAHFPQNSQK